LTPISTLVHAVPVTEIMQPLQINVYITLFMLSFIPLHFLCIISGINDQSPFYGPWCEWRWGC